MQRLRVWSTAAVVLVLLLLLSSCTFTTAAAAAAESLSVRQLQHQRQRAFTKYAQRVGAALHLLTNGLSDTLDDGDAQEAAASKGGNGNTHTPQPPPSPTPSGDNFFAFIAHAAQYPHAAVQAAVQVVSQKAAAVRVLASVLSGASLSDDVEAQLGMARAVAKGQANAFDDEPMRQPSAQAVRTARASAFAPPRTTAVSGEGSARRVSTLADAASPSPFISCVNGYVALTSSTRLSCQGMWWLTLGQYSSLPESVKRTCSIVQQSYWWPDQQQCICPLDALLVQVADRAYVCMTRPVDVQVLLDDAYLCNSAADASLGLPSVMESEYCIKTSRNAKLNLAVRWRYTYMTLDALKAAVRTPWVFITPNEFPASGSSLRWVVLGKTPPTGLITAQNGSPYAMGTYSELTVNPTLFSFLSPITAEADAEAAAAGREAFYITSNSSLYEAFAFSAIFSFAKPRMTMDHLKEVPLSSSEQMSTYFGNLNGISAHTLELDLSTVSDDFVEGNQMYVETGIRGGTMAYTYRVARLHVSFTDLAAPPANTHKYPKQFNPLYILLIVVIGVVLIGAGLAVLWYHLMQKEEYDDNMVADAQRKKNSKMAAKK